MLSAGGDVRRNTTPAAGEGAGAQLAAAARLPPGRLLQEAPRQLHAGSDLRGDLIYRVYGLGFIVRILVVLKCIPPKQQKWKIR